MTKYIDKATGGQIAVKSIIFILSPDLTSVSFRTLCKGMCYEFLCILMYGASCFEQYFYMKTVVLSKGLKNWEAYREG